MSNTTADEAAVTELAARLYEKMEALAPGVDEYVPWAQLPEPERRVYRFPVEDLSRYEDLWRRLG